MFLKTLGTFTKYLDVISPLEWSEILLRPKTFIQVDGSVQVSFIVRKLHVIAFKKATMHI